MLNLFGRTRVKHPVNPRYKFYEGRDFVPGGAGWVFMPDHIDPIVPMTGTGIVAGEFGITSRPALAFAPVAPVQPMPTIVGDTYIQPAKNGSSR